MKLEAAAFEAAFEFAAVGIVMTTKDGRFLRINDAFCRMSGYDHQELQGKSLQSLTYEEDLKIGSEALNDLLSGKSKTAQIRRRYVHKSGRLIWVELNITLLLDESGNPQHFVTIVHDVSEEFRTSDMLQKRINELDCLNDIGHEIDESIPLPEFFRWISERIPFAFQDPENCIAAVEYDGHDLWRRTGIKAAIQIRRRYPQGR